MYIFDWNRRISPHNRLRPPSPSFLITSSILSNIYGSFHTKINSNAHIYIQTPQRLSLVADNLRNTIRHGRPSECHHIRRQTACSQGRWVVMVRGRGRTEKRQSSRPRNQLFAVGRPDFLARYRDVSYVGILMRQLSYVTNHTTQEKNPSATIIGEYSASCHHGALILSLVRARNSGFDKKMCFFPAWGGL